MLFNNTQSLLKLKINNKYVFHYFNQNKWSKLSVVIGRSRFIWLVFVFQDSLAVTMIMNVSSEKCNCQVAFKFHSLCVIKDVFDFPIKHEIPRGILPYGVNEAISFLKSAHNADFKIQICPVENMLKSSVIKENLSAG